MLDQTGELEARIRERIDFRVSVAETKTSKKIIKGETKPYRTHTHARAHTHIHTTVTTHTNAQYRLSGVV